MGYQLISEATGETLLLSSREWEMLRKLAPNLQVGRHGKIGITPEAGFVPRKP